ncbi:MAG: hypothetical protein J3Q66DRAFT_372815 [Benniella sp.]|nr:MAG: hypothetical protein J3Q66DRAFT_372815 [Benniella sp.]
MTEYESFSCRDGVLTAAMNPWLRDHKHNEPSGGLQRRPLEHWPRWKKRAKKRIKPEANPPPFSDLPPAPAPNPSLLDHLLIIQYNSTMKSTFVILALAVVVAMAQAAPAVNNAGNLDTGIFDTMDGRSQGGLGTSSVPVYETLRKREEAKKPDLKAILEKLKGAVGGAAKS